MSFRRAKAQVQLLRPTNMAIAFLTIAAGGLLSSLSAPRWLEITIAGLAGAFIVGGGNALNDCLDLEVDRINRPLRPLPSGVLSVSDANATWVSFSIFGIALSYQLTEWNLYLGVFWVALLYAYSRWLKRMMLVGNLVIGLLTGTAFLFGALALNDVSRTLFPGFFAFLINVAREILKDVEDIEGDRIVGADTLPVRYGVRPSLLMASCVVLLLILATPLPYVLNIYTKYYLWIVSIVDLVLFFLIYSWWKDQSTSNLRRLSSILKAAMIAGLLAIFAGSWA